MSEFIEPGKIYLADNGRAICHKCAGVSAKTTGRDISGQAVHECTDNDAAYMETLTGQPLSCESGCTVYREAA